MASRSPGSSFTRRGTPVVSLPSPCCRPGPHGTFLISSGFSDLDKILGGGFPVGSLVFVMEDIYAPHHLLLLRYFMAQGLVHRQPLLFGSTTTSSQAFLGTIPGISKPKESLKEDASSNNSEAHGLRIAWQYRKFIDNEQSLEDRRLQQLKSMHELQGVKIDYCSTFDLKKPVERSLLTSGDIECIDLVASTTLAQLQEKCKNFCLRNTQKIGHLAFQSLCSPQWLCSDKDWAMLGFLQNLKTLVRASNAVAMITFPATLLSSSFLVRWQHMADVLLSVEAVPDDDDGMAKLVTDYHDIVGFLRILKLPCINTQVPTYPETAVHALKFARRRTLTLEKLNQAPIDASVESSNKNATTLLCSGPVNATSVMDF